MLFKFCRNWFCNRFSENLKTVSFESTQKYRIFIEASFVYWFSKFTNWFALAVWIALQSVPTYYSLEFSTGNKSKTHKWLRVKETKFLRINCIVTMKNKPQPSNSYIIVYNAKYEWILDYLNVVHLLRFSHISRTRIIFTYLTNYFWTKLVFFLSNSVWILTINRNRKTTNWIDLTEMQAIVTPLDI